MKKDAIVADWQIKELRSFYDGLKAHEYVGQPTNQVYALYRERCENGRVKTLSQIEFSRQMVKCFGLKIIQKKLNKVKQRVFQSSS